MLTPEQINNLPPDTKKRIFENSIVVDEKKNKKVIRDKLFIFCKIYVA